MAELSGESGELSGKNATTGRRAVREMLRVERAPGALQVVTPWGWALVLVVMIGMPIALVLGWRELVLAAFAAFVLIVAALPWVLGNRVVHVELALSTQRVRVGGTASVRVTATRVGRTLPPRTLDIVIGDEVFRVHVHRLAVGESHEQVVPLDTSRRGRVNIGPVSVLRSDPLGILQREHRLAEPVELIVHPRTVRVPGVAAGLVRDLEGEAAAELTADDVSFHMLRDYRPGDDRRLVHWKSSAKSGQLLVKQFEPTQRSDTMLCISTSPRDYENDDFELGLSIAATIGVAAINDRRGLRVVESRDKDGDRAHEIDARTKDRLLDALTDMRDDRDGDVAELVHAVAAGSKASIAWIVVGGGADARTIRKAVSSVPPHVVAVVLRAVVDAQPGVAQLGKATVVTVGALDDLPRTLGAGSLV